MLDSLLTRLYGAIPDISEIFAGTNLVETPDRNGLFITGRGCEGSTKIRYLNFVSEDLDKHECCTFINLKHNSEPPLSERLDLDCWIGDGRGETEKKLSGTFNTEENCIIAVKKQYPSAIEATIKTGCSSTYSCYAEFGMIEFLECYWYLVINPVCFIKLFIIEFMID